MLDYAKKYEAELKNLFHDTFMDFSFKYCYLASWRDELEIPSSTYNEHSFASLRDDKVIGYISYKISRDSDAIYAIQLINFSKDKSYTFGKDAMTCVKDIFEKYNFRKIAFSVTIGNPVEKQYDRIITRYGGRIVGIKRQEYKLIDGKYYDIKEYEIFAENYFKAINKARPASGLGVL
jgi:hypothetical protein